MDIDLSKNRQTYFTIFILAALANLTGLLNDVFISDAALYASIAKEMVLNNNFINLTHNGVDWLDKPHLPFWITAVSFKIFGINSFAYKLPAVLFTFLALFYTYKLAKELISKNTARLAVLILFTAEHLVISNNDVRAEPYLTGMIIASVYYYHRVILIISKERGLQGEKQNSFMVPLLLASFFAGGSIMTKGLFTLIPIFGAVGGELIIKKKWKTILNWRWILSGALIILFISPELYALYQQFDLHPEKMVFGRTGVSGIRFFLWDSQFGRFLNTGPITGKGDPLFFLHTLLWAFFPWSILMYWSVFRKIRGNIPKIKQSDEFYTVSGSLLALLIFSLSGFQLPHYTNIIFPFLAILTAELIQHIHSRREILFYSVSQYVWIIITLVFLGFLMVIFRPEINLVFPVLSIIIIGLVVAFSLKFRESAVFRLFLYSCLASILLNFFLNLVFYPQLLNYQSGSKAAEYANYQFPGQQIRILGVLSHCMLFHADAEAKVVSLEDLTKEILDENRDEKILLFTSESYLDSLDNIQIKYRIIETFDHFHTTKLNGTFLNHKTRENAIRKQYLLEF